MLATYLESKVNLVVPFNGRSGLLDEYGLFVRKCLHEFDATYVVEWDGVCKGLLCGEVETCHTFVVGSGAHDTNDPHDSYHDVQGCSALKRAT